MNLELREAAGAFYGFQWVLSGARSRQNTSLGNSFAGHSVLKGIQFHLNDGRLSIFHILYSLFSSLFSIEKVQM